MKKFMNVLLTIGCIIMLTGGLMIVGSVMQYFGVIPFTEICLFITGIQTFVYGAVVVAIPMGYYIPQMIKEEH